ncbi:MAG: YbjN domain-containing protein [Ilumatobacteraceae bacterium]
MSDLHGADAIETITHQIDAWLADFAETNPAIAAVNRDDGDEPRWYVRMIGEEKEFITVWLTLGQRTLRYEAYVMPAPEENTERVYENLLRRNQGLVGHHFAIGVEDAVFLRGDLPVAVLSEDELDRVIGSLYATTEQCFQSLLRIGFASRFA